MTRDWKRLGDAIKAARKARGMRQIDLAEAADVSESTIQNFESGEARGRVPTSLPKIERALEWAEGSGRDILAGGEATPVQEGAQDEAAAPPSAAGRGPEVPLRVVQELGNGPLLDTTVFHLTGEHGEDIRMLAVVKGKPSASPEELRRALLLWEQAEMRLRGVRDDEGGEPEAEEA